MYKTRCRVVEDHQGLEPTAAVSRAADARDVGRLHTRLAPPTPIIALWSRPERPEPSRASRASRVDAAIRLARRSSGGDGFDAAIRCCRDARRSRRVAEDQRGATRCRLSWQTRWVGTWGRHARGIAAACCGHRSACTLLCRFLSSGRGSASRRLALLAKSGDGHPQQKLVLEVGCAFVSLSLPSTINPL